MPDLIATVKAVTEKIRARSDVAMQAIHEISKAVTGTIVGAGTVTRPGQFAESIEAGAQFAVSPGLTDALIDASQAGGIAMLKALNGPLPDVRFCPTGGIGADNFIDFLELPNVVCVGGSRVCPASAVQNRDWDQISQLASDVRNALE